MQTYCWMTHDLPVILIFIIIQSKCVNDITNKNLSIWYPSTDETKPKVENLKLNEREGILNLDLSKKNLENSI